MNAGPLFPLGGEPYVGSTDVSSLGIEDALRDIAGATTSMLAAFGANGIRTVEDLAACATDDLVGWTEQRGAEVTRHPGILGDLVMSRQECDALILRARVRAGWIEAAALTS